MYVANVMRLNCRGYIFQVEDENPELGTSYDYGRGGGTYALLITGANDA